MVLFKFNIPHYVVKAGKFTFHYGPIQIERGRVKRYERLKFTFHYGPIQMVANIFLMMKTDSIYIPLWSYSNQIPSLTHLHIELQFTFHYGPIQMIQQ